MNARLIRNCLLIMLLCILPVSFGIGFIFAPMTLGYSLPIAIYVLPFVCIIGGYISLLFIRNISIKRGYARGIHLSALLWLALCICLLTIPFSTRFYFRQVVPGLEQFLLEREGEMIARAVNGKYEYSEDKGHVSRITLNGWQSLDVGTNLTSLELWGQFQNPYDLKDTAGVVKKICELIDPFLNDSGRKVLTQGKINSQHIPGGFSVRFMDTGAPAIEMEIRMQNVLVLIEKEYSLLD